MYAHDYTPDPDPPPEQAQLSFQSSAYQGNESTNLTFRIERAIRTDQVVEVDWAVSNASTVPSSGTERFEVGESFRDVTIALDPVLTDESGTISLSNPVLISGGEGAPILVSPSSATLQIFDTSTNPDIPDWPLVTAGFAIAWGSQRRTQEPWLSNFGYKNFRIHQMIGFLNSESRQTRWAEFETLNNVFNGIDIAHHDFHYVQIDWNSAGPTAWHEDLIYADAANFDDWISQNANGDYYGEGFSYDLAHNWQGPKYIQEALAERVHDDISNYDNSGSGQTSGNVARDYALGLMQDTLGYLNANVRYVRPRHQSIIRAVIDSNTFEIDSYPDSNESADFTGAVENGYTTPGSSIHAIVLRQNRTAGYSNNCVGIRYVSPTRDEVILDGSPNFTPSVGDTIHFTRGDNTGSTSNVGDRDLYHENTLHLLNHFASIQSTRYGNDVGTYANMGGLNFLVKVARAGTADAYLMPVEAWNGQWDGIHGERINRDVGFGWESGDTFYRSDQHGRHAQYDPNDIIRYLALGMYPLKTNAASPTNYPCHWLNAQSVRYRGVGATTLERDADAYTKLDLRYDGAFVRWWYLLAWVHRNCAPQCEIGLGHDNPITLEEEMIGSLLGAPVSPRNIWESYDPYGNSGGGSWVQRTADFGNWGYFFEFENGGIQINFRPPDSYGDWVPSHLDGYVMDGQTLTGQTINPSLDRFYLPSAGTGYEWRAFDSNNFVNTDPNSKFYNMTPSDLDSVYILRDPIFNDGSARGAYFDTGPFEGAIHMRVPV